MQIGLRGSLWDGNDFAYAEEAGMRVITYDEYDEMGRDAAIAEIRRVVGTGPAYVTYDIDGLDPTQAPGTARDGAGRLLDARLAGDPARA